MWKVYSWAEVDPDALPWLPDPEKRDAEASPVISELVDPADRDDADGLGFVPNHTYQTVLTRNWLGHPAGSRVLLETTEIAVETSEPV